MTSSWLTQNRIWLWRVGVEHRERLMMQYMVMFGLTERPPIQNVYRELIEEIQGVRILDGALPMDRYAQTEIVRGRPVITINSLIGRMPGVKDEHGIAHVAAWHESIHIPVDVERREISPFTDLTSGLEGLTSSPLLCSASQASSGRWPLREQAIETAALAAAVADADLRRCSSYLQFIRLAASGDDMGPAGWRLLGWISTAIGVNRTALLRYFEQHGICRFSAVDGKNRLIGIPTPFRGFTCLEPEPATHKSTAWEISFVTPSSPILIG